tara:strand:- start:14703 stop:15152 length:450 start_codon:yes stop_codon:yes gene_type:complete
MSQISADTIKGVTAANNITLGNTPIVSASANSLTIRGEGSAQTSIQQGLAKVWMNMNQGTTTNGSFNTSGLTDNGTGDYTITIANNMANDDYAAHHTASDANTNTSVLVGVTKGGSLATGSFDVYVLNEDTGVSDGSDPSSISVLGDLA